MNLNQKISNNSQNIVDKITMFNYIEGIRNINYSYSNRHRISNQIRWLELIRDSYWKENLVE